jgi:hypothetical protein
MGRLPLGRRARPARDAEEQDDRGAVAGDVTTMEWIRDRVRHTLDQPTAARLDAQLRDLRAAADGGEDVLPAAANAAPALLQTLAAA